MAQHYQRMNAVLVGIGGVFDVYGGLRRRAPGWMQRWALKWLYCLLQEPGRMLKRYAMTNSIFIVSSCVNGWPLKSSVFLKNNFLGCNQSDEQRVMPKERVMRARYKEVQEEATYKYFYTNLHNLNTKACAQ
jgi:hypothetical protein